MDRLTSLALCWHVLRRDGVAIGLTSHDRDLVRDGFVYRAAPGMTPSAISRGDPLAADTLDVTGALSAEAITAHDLSIGRWDSAAVRLFATDWADASVWNPLASGRIGAVQTQDGGFTAELEGAGAALDRPVAETTAPDCRASLGDARCRVPIAGRRRFACLVEAAGSTLTVDALEPLPDSYGGGVLRWFDGAEAGQSRAILASDGATVTLRAAPAVPPVAGALIELVEGCDKMLATCAVRFDNAVNFQGEPFLPGIDLLTRYPGA